MKNVLLLISVLLSIHTSYVADNTTIFPNPERGFTEEMSRKVSEDHPNVVKGNINSSWRSYFHMSLAVVLYNFNYYKESDLPEAVLQGFDEDMQALRDNGLKCVLRFAYTESISDKVDATPEWVARHLEQLKPHLERNADVIYVLEAGFIGVWGEWYYTTHYGNESQHMNENRRAVIDALFANVPSDRFILFRYPMIKTEYLGDDTPLETDEAFTQTVKARMGCHNDAFLNSWGNDGTYASDDKSDDPEVRAYIAQETLYVPNGGETNVEEESLAKQVYTKAPEEMSTYHWSFCGKSYATAVTGKWRSSGIFDTLNIHMGYRYNLKDGQFSEQAAPGGKMNVTIRLRNDGYAPMYNERKAYIVLRNEQSTVRIEMAADPRRWLPNGVMSSINEQISLPDDMAEGTYRLYLYLPDHYTSIADDPRFAVRIANEGVWDEQTGMNDLGAEVVISNEAPMDPGELPLIEPEGIEKSEEPCGRRTRKVIENGIFYIETENGKKYYCF